MAVKRFFDTHGGSMMDAIGLEREVAASAMRFEEAAVLHERWHKVKAAAALADELVQPVPRLRAVIIAGGGFVGENRRTLRRPLVFCWRVGVWWESERLSTLGGRAVKEQTSVGSSLFAQPLMLAPVPLDEAGSTVAVEALRNRLRNGLRLCWRSWNVVPAQSHVSESRHGAPKSVGDVALLSDHLSLLRRWF